ncbi:protein of unknown function [Nitrospira japonica]|uniref:Uncharacterized protein n=1 Tax=Nitrospira japonica TaxID=1325564 RepID=A0A1W1I873_9BACT|nr:hypothetical protein [Nitrospira japonica]SLM49185.1 protein of unknown function [Nitrospira japonica]
MTKSVPYRDAICALTLTWAIVFWLPLCAFAEEPASPDTAPTISEESPPPAEGADIQERGLLPGLVKPGGTLQLADPKFSAPTPSLTAIRNAMRVTSKSISVNLRIPPNLPVTVPIEVEVFYSSPFRSQILKRTYSSTSGLTLSYRDVEGNGEPRAMKLVITVRELVPNGQVTGINKEFTITPLYDVFVTDLRFYMVDRCDTVGKSDITFKWRSPDRQIHEQKFKLGRGEARGITQFSWTRKEISTRANLMEPSVYFDERDPLGDYTPPIEQSGKALLPGPTTKYHFFLKEETGGPPGRPSPGGGCEAEITYTIIRALMPFDQF